MSSTLRANDMSLTDLRRRVWRALFFPIGLVAWNPKSFYDSICVYSHWNVMFRSRIYRNTDS